MRGLVLVLLTVLIAAVSYGEDAESDSLIHVVVSDFMSALQAGEGSVASDYFSSSALDQVEVMLVSIKHNLGDDPEAVMRRLSGVGYAVELDVAEDWETKEYLSATLSLPMMAARYAPYELEVSSIEVDGRDALVDMIFRTTTGVEIPQQAVMVYEDDTWKVSSFMGITAFP
ncbi:MAG: hypothetical protein KAH31_03435 [Candidatus Sabulitectum sp.]|nr:hypothetical protein [Candidatus Sabulitectum sp.]